MTKIDPLTQRVAALPDGRVFLALDTRRPAAWNAALSRTINQIVKSSGPATWRRPTQADTIANPEAIEA